MSLHFDTNACQTAETLPPIAWRAFPDDPPHDTNSNQHEQPRVCEDRRARYLESGTRIISWDKGSSSVLCTEGGEWSVWLLDADGKPIRGSYFRTLRAAAYDYAERVMGYHSGVGDEEASDSEE